MTDPTPQIQPYPQTKIRVTASYRAGTVGEVVPAGQPETVEIEINETVPADDLLEFVTGLVASLFAAAGEGVLTDVVVDPDPADGPDLPAMATRKIGLAP